jgi:hypothetical protein
MLGAGKPLLVTGLASVGGSTRILRPRRRVLGLLFVVP